jgi:hypothetical protein
MPGLRLAQRFRSLIATEINDFILQCDERPSLVDESTHSDTNFFRSGSNGGMTNDTFFATFGN